VGSYEQEYFRSIHKSLEQSIFKVKNKKIDASLFFDDLLGKTSRVKSSGGRIFFFGNGASAAFSNHMALDWSKNGGVLALSLSDSALLTALSNDYSYEMAFVEFLKINQVSKNDLVVTVSSSGNSKNIVNVLEYCNENNIVSFGLSGLKEDNKTAIYAYYSLYIPRKTYGLVECIHQIYLHLWLDKYMKIQDWSRETFQDMNSSNYNL
jgi:D-sedoheptulose 7-phosphate isomerase